ncbi:MAG: PilN domain-containing protein [Thermodesulfovibrionaceae bacterium]
MIKINLLPKKEVKKVTKFELRITRDIFKRLLIPVGLAILLIGIVFGYCEVRKMMLQEKITEQKASLQLLQKKIEEVKKFEAMNKEVESKVKLIENLKKMQSAPLVVLSTIVRRLPDGVWLTAIKYEEEITLEGIGFSNLNIVNFVENLKAVGEFTDVALVESQQTEYEKQQLYKFTIKFKYRI